MDITQEIIDVAAGLSVTHNLKEVFVTEKGEFFASARECNNSGAKQAKRVFPAPTFKSESIEEVAGTPSDKLTLDDENGATDSENTQENTAINTAENSDESTEIAAEEQTQVAEEQNTKPNSKKLKAN